MQASSFILDMSAVFEQFVYVALREALGLSEQSFPRGARGRTLRLDTVGQIALQPDLSRWDGPDCTFVGDAKYKRLGVQEVKHTDLYQLLTSTVATDLPGGLLIYAAWLGTIQAW